MSVDPAQATPVQPVIIQEAHHLVMRRDRCLGEVAEQSQYRAAIGDTAARQLPDDERMAEHFPGVEQLHEPIVAAA